MNSDFSYTGTELEIFQQATVWKNYYGQHLFDFLGAEVLEVGAGIGGTTRSLCRNKQTSWVCLEPDKQLASELQKQIAIGELPSVCKVMNRTVWELRDDELFDSIIYIDVLEHIENDVNELKMAAKHLKENGHLIVLSPAHQFLFTPFDQSVGHFRRYNKACLNSVVPQHLNCVLLIYLDSVGALASIANKLILNTSKPSHKQIHFWDKTLVPISKVFDRVFGYHLGKSILGIWKNES